MQKQIHDKYSVYEVIRIGNDLDLESLKGYDIEPTIPHVMLRDVNQTIPKRVKKLAKALDIDIDVEDGGNQTAIVGWRFWIDSPYIEHLDGYVEVHHMEVVIRENKKVRGL